ncbi:MAG TPA: hypothetical protein VMT32_02925 [Bryobacteraceae bacterium]|nr:hypothetical protein [Bryobacteraceae bacterium]
MPAGPDSVRMIRKLLPFASAGVALAALYVAFVFVSRWQENRRLESAAAEAARAKAQREISAIYGDGKLRILDFYVAPGIISHGQKALLCYGVANANSVRLEPAVERMYPAISRCFEVAPPHDTRYTLTAEDAQGHTATESFMLQVK